MVLIVVVGFLGVCVLGIGVWIMVFVGGLCIVGFGIIVFKEFFDFIWLYKDIDKDFVLFYYKVVKFYEGLVK